jgi:hypothetical protein
MTRTILNWSELLDNYHEDCEDPRKLKKWSDMGEPERKKEIPQIVDPLEKIRDAHSEHSAHEEFSELNSQPPHIIEIQKKTQNQEFDSNDILNKNKYQHREQFSDESPNKAKLLEIFYDQMMQDTETIPTMIGLSDSKDNNELTARESILLELLEVNIEKNS